MISAEIVRCQAGKIIAFTVKNHSGEHGQSIVCAAVSMLVINTVNSIEVLTEDVSTCDYNENGGFLTFALTDPANRTLGCGILLDALFIGLTETKTEYPNEIEIKEIFGASAM